MRRKPCHQKDIDPGTASKKQVWSWYVRPKYQNLLNTSSKKQFLLSGLRQSGPEERNQLCERGRVTAKKVTRRENQWESEISFLQVSSRIGVCWNKVTCYPCSICNRRKIHQGRTEAGGDKLNLHTNSPKIIFKKLAGMEIQLINWQIISHLFNERLQGEGEKALN